MEYCIVPIRTYMDNPSPYEITINLSDELSSADFERLEASAESAELSPGDFAKLIILGNSEGNFQKMGLLRISNEDRLRY